MNGQADGSRPGWAQLPTLYAEHPCGRATAPQALEAMLTAYGGHLLDRAAHNQHTTPHLAAAQHRRGLAALAWPHQRLNPPRLAPDCATAALPDTQKFFVPYRFPHRDKAHDE